MEDNKIFVDKYKDLVTRNICESHSVDYDDVVARANLAHKLLTGEDKVLMVPLHKEVPFVITAHGEFADKSIKKRYGRLTDLVIEPLEVACNILAENSIGSPTSEGIVLDDTLCATMGNLMWIAKLFAFAHNFYKMCGEDKTPDLWKMCDHSYDCNHIEPSMKISSKGATYFGFMTGSCDGPKYENWDYGMHGCDVFLNTEYFKKSAQVTFEVKDILTAYINEHNLNVHFYKDQRE